MNEQIEKALGSAVANIESRKQSEKLLILGMLVAGLVLMYLSLAFDPIRAELAALRAGISSLEGQIASQRNSYQEMLAQSQEDPNRFVNERLAVIQREQSVLDQEIQSLAGDLVTPNQMTEILTTVLERQSGLELISFRNSDAEPLREGASNAQEVLAETGAVNFENLVRDEVAGQVYSHGLTIVFEGDFFSTLKYLRFLEEITGSFFWDGIRFEQTDWPDAHITLEIHTLSTDQGFIGV